MGGLGSVFCGGGRGGRWGDCAWQGFLMPHLIRVPVTRRDQAIAIVKAGEARRTVHTHSLSLFLSLSHTHTHTYKHPRACMYAQTRTYTRYKRWYVVLTTTVPLTILPAAVLLCMMIGECAMGLFLWWTRRQPLK